MISKTKDPARHCPHCGKPSTAFKLCIERRLYKSEWSQRKYRKRV